MIRMILTDLDDTLLRSDKTVSPLSVETLRRCRSAGIAVGICTARGESSVLSFIDSIQPDAVISCGGAMVRWRGGIVRAAQFTPEETQMLIGAGLRMGCNMTSDTLTGHYRNYREQNADSTWGVVHMTDFSGPCEPSMKVCFEVEDPSVLQDVASAVRNCDWLRFSGTNWYKFTRADATKESAVCALSEHTGIPLAEMMAFGDDYGDAGMLRICGVGVAVANAIPEVRAAADAIAPGNDDDGVAKYLLSALGL